LPTLHLHSFPTRRSSDLLRKLVVVAEVALSFVLLIGSGLMLRSFLELQRTDPGFDPHSLLTFQVLGNRGGTKPEERAAFMRRTRSEEHTSELQSRSDLVC